MVEDFTHARIGKSETKVHRLGLSASYWPGKKTVHKAFDEGLDLFFCFGFDMQMTRVLRDVAKTNRQNMVIATGAYNLLYGHPDIRRTLEKRLKQLKTDYIDMFLFLGVTKAKHLDEKVREDMYRLKEEGKVRAVGMSCHDRKFAGQMADEGALDTLMIRYNAAHRGAETDIFPYLPRHKPGVIGYTATRWTYLIRRSRQWPKDRPIPTPGMCYRFVLSNPNIDVCLTAPRNIKQLNDNIAALKDGPLNQDEMNLIKEYGDMIHNQKKYFM